MNIFQTLPCCFRLAATVVVTFCFSFFVPRAEPSEDEDVADFGLDMFRFRCFLLTWPDCWISQDETENEKGPEANSTFTDFHIHILRV